MTYSRKPVISGSAGYFHLFPEMIRSFDGAVLEMYESVSVLVCLFVLFLHAQVLAAIDFEFSVTHSPTDSND